jgi:hypothetical protein
MRVRPDRAFDLLGVAGALSLLLGIGLASVPLAIIVAGVLLVGVACWGAQADGRLAARREHERRPVPPSVTPLG